MKSEVDDFNGDSVKRGTKKLVSSPLELRFVVPQMNWNRKSKKQV